MISYTPLARTYRPQSLDDLHGQDILVKTLKNCFQSGKIPQAFIFHGIRGVGKTTTARIIAKALNCTEIATDKRPCNTCSSCLSINNDHHVDVLEMDAASRTGVDDVREIIDTIQYKAVQGNYRIYIVDEVHMLSKSAFNALLKTLEEPPAHVKFIFATTELKKIPDTILSRCMYFDLKKIDIPTLSKLLQNICNKEGFTIDQAAIQLIAQAAEGSARDAISLLDQASLLSDGNIHESVVRDMLGYADPTLISQVITHLFSNDVVETITQTRKALHLGASALAFTDHLLDGIYTLICLQKLPSLSQAGTQTYSNNFIQSIPATKLMQSWQVLSKGREDVFTSAFPEQALEMALLRLMYLSELPYAADLLQFVQSQPKTTISPPVIRQPQLATPTTIPTTLPTANTSTNHPKSFEALAQVFMHNNEPLLYSHLIHDVESISFSPPSIVVNTKPSAPKSLIRDLNDCLQRFNFSDWKFILDSQAHHKGPTLAEQNARITEEKNQKAVSHPIVETIRSAFPDADITVKAR